MKLAVSKTSINIKYNQQRRRDYLQTKFNLKIMKNSIKRILKIKSTEQPQRAYNILENIP
jgi:hypothetical protein